MLEDVTLPVGAAHVRTTPEFTADTMPVGLSRAHRVASGVWGCLRVRAGAVTFVLEATGERRLLGQGDLQVIEPDAAHHVEPDPEATFVIEFYR